MIVKRPSSLRPFDSLSLPRVRMLKVGEVKKTIEGPGERGEDPSLRLTLKGERLFILLAFSSYQLLTWVLLLAIPNPHLNSSISPGGAQS